MLSFIRYSLKPFDDIGCAFPEVYFCCFDDFFVDVIQMCLLIMPISDFEGLISLQDGLLVKSGL